MDRAEYFKLEHKRRKVFQRGYCLHPSAPAQCSKNFIAAHTVQRAMIENFLAEDKHVLQFRHDVNPDINAMLFSPERIGHRVATTFHGFCGFHDNALFTPLEFKSFAFEERQIALLGFRSFSRELYQKEAESDMNTALKDHMLENEHLQSIERLMFLYQKRVAILNACQNLKNAWRTFGDMLTKNSFTELRYLAIQFSHPPAYFASTAFLPEWDFEGGQIQDLDEIDTFHGVSFSAWAADGNATAVFCWHSTWDAVCMPFIQSFINVPEDRWANRILSMAFEMSENVIMKPSWWEGLTEHDRDLLSQRVPSGLMSLERQATCLCEDGLNALPSDVIRIEHNL